MKRSGCRAICRLSGRIAVTLTIRFRKRIVPSGQCNGATGGYRIIGEFSMPAQEAFDDLWLAGADRRHRGVRLPDAYYPCPINPFIILDVRGLSFSCRDMKTLRLALASLFFGLLLPMVLLAYADSQYLLDPWENAPRQMLFVFLAPVVAIVCGHLAILTSRQSVGMRWRKLFAIGGLLLGYVGLAAILIYPILNHRRPHFEATAVGSMRTLNVAIHGFADEHGHFPSDLSDLACKHGHEEYDWCVDGVLASGMKGAYRFAYTLQKASGGSQIESYEIHADPTKSTPYTRHHFFTNETGLIRFEYDKPAELTSKPL